MNFIIESKTNFVVPKIDSSIGISVYSTSFEGCGGKIRTKAEEFFVSEILSPDVLAKITESQGYSVYLLKKKNIDTNHALQNIFRKTGIRLKALGLKDSSAITEQFVCSVNKSKSLVGFDSEKFSIKKIGFVKKPLSKKDMVGNRFSIKVTDASSKISEFEEFDKVLNFFGYQRFGSKRPVTHLIGKEILLGNYSNAIELLVSFTSEYDSKNNIDLRKNLRDPLNYAKFVKDIPKQMDLEKTVITEMLQHNDPKKALKALPLSIRRFFIQAYQSFLFNKTLSTSFDHGEDLSRPKEGDVCYDKNGVIGKFSNLSGQSLAIPTVGYSYYKKTRFHIYISEILEEEQISPKNFFSKEMQEISSEAGFRNAMLSCRDFSIADKMVAFTLSRGSFATILLREIMKPKDPILAGF